MKRSIITGGVITIILLLLSATTAVTQMHSTSIMNVINNFENNVDAMTVQRANEIIAKYFPRENLQFVLIGKADEIRDKVKKYGIVTEKDIEDDGF